MDMEHNKGELPEKKDDRPDFSQLNAVENFYERFRGVNPRHLDIFIGCCVAALILVLTVGILKGQGIL